MGRDRAAFFFWSRARAALCCPAARKSFVSGSANGNRTCIAPVQSGSPGSKCLQTRAPGTALEAPRPPRMPDVAPRWHLARPGRWSCFAHRGHTFAPSLHGGGTVPAHHRRASMFTPISSRLPRSRNSAHRQWAACEKSMCGKATRRFASRFRSSVHTTSGIPPSKTLLVDPGLGGRSMRTLPASRHRSRTIRFWKPR